MAGSGILRGLNVIAFGAVALGGIGFCLGESMYTVDGGERALIFDKFDNGTKNYVVEPGTHFLIPWVQKPIIYDVRITPFNIRSETGSKDMQKVNIALRILYRPDIKRLPQIYQRLGVDDYSTKVLQSVGNEVLKAVVAQYDATELITNRESISLDMRHRLVTRAETFGLELEDVSITHLDFSPEYVRAIEGKQVAQQLAEKAKWIVVKSEQEKQATLIYANAEATAAELIGKAMVQGPGFVILRKIEAARQIAEELSRSRNVIYLPSGGNGSNILLNIDTAS
eukprot:TRINITY_DN3807_c0_g4_i1.p1 TRINITY_DN3807_c0_g4~~TRINITY_DN3807_c0_g4_i1.p1  ORF type:complete len:283 (+),score=77.75 TRINITY_DN3807_c0_g4_i1:64-912(+)